MRTFVLAALIVAGSAGPGQCPESPRRSLDESAHHNQLLRQR